MSVMSGQIEAILFDMGGTLRRGINREFSEKVELCKPILELIDWKADPVDFARMLDARANAYRKWSRQELAELNEVGFWSQWMLPELGMERISAIAVELTQIWRNADRVYQVFPDSRETILGLFRAGYHLGLVSNTSSSTEAPNLLNELGVAACFEAVVLSCQVGIRKPRPEILLEATRQMGVEPGRCAYIGNLPDRDVASARRAGFKQTVILRDPNRSEEPIADPAFLPDHYIDNLRELLAIFPARDGRTTKTSNGRVFDISLSTMWGMKRFADLNDFLSAASRLGFGGIELNHQVSPAMLEGLDLSHCRVSSVHEPCPAAISAQSLRKRDLLISSPDEARRQQGVDSIKPSIDLAHELGAHTVVVHAGQVQADGTLEEELRALYNNGQAHSSHSAEVRDRLVQLRTAFVEPYLQSVKRSLQELLEYASRYHIRLGIENRYHYLDIPSLDEMGDILDLAGQDQIGFIYDVGHAQTLDRLGFHQHEDWLKRFASRIIGVHLHDVNGVDDHRAPGLGEVDFRMVAPYLPEEAFRTLEVQSSNTPDQIKAGIKILVDSGCVRLIEQGEP
jgi:FMN phosphatase YigB (HAD superfamily)/sugar phosphate isomerase/epimerase